MTAKQEFTVKAESIIKEDDTETLLQVVAKPRVSIQVVDLCTLNMEDDPLCRAITKCLVSFAKPNGVLLIKSSDPYLMVTPYRYVFYYY